MNISNRPRTAVMALLLACALGVPRAADPDLVGFWEGTLDAGGARLRMVFTISRGPDGGLVGEAASPDQGASGIPVTEVVQEGRTVRLEVRRIGGTLEGTLGEDGQRLDGTWKQGGRTFPIVLTRSAEAPAGPPAPEPGQEPSEIWQGSLGAGGGTIRLVFRIYQLEGGIRTGFLDSPDQGAKDIPVTDVSVDGDAVRFGVNAIGGGFEGVRSADGETIEGRWSQGGAAVPLTLSRVDESPQVRRPQNPKKPYPYREEEVAYDSRAKGVRLAATLTLPREGAPFPAVLLLTGSGSQDRDETVFGHKPFLVLADHLTRRGIAVLRADDRGVGGSTGDPSTATSADFVEDALAGVDYLRSRPEIDRHRIGLVGHSEGGLVAPIAATRSNEVAFLVLMAGPGIDGAETLRLQGAAIGRVQGWSEEALKQHAAMQEAVFSAVRREKDPGALADAVRAVVGDAMAVMGEEVQEALGLSEDAIEAQVAFVSSPWFRHFVDFDPAPVLREVDCPVLALNGGLDLQVLPKENLSAIRDALVAGGNRNVETREFPGLNHLFQSAETGAPSEYGSIEETMSPDVLEAISGWVLEQGSRAVKLRRPAAQ